MKINKISLVAPYSFDDIEVLKIELQDVLDIDKLDSIKILQIGSFNKLMSQFCKENNLILELIQNDWSKNRFLSDENRINCLLEGVELIILLKDVELDFLDRIEQQALQTNVKCEVILLNKNTSEIDKLKIKSLDLQQLYFYQKELKLQYDNHLQQQAYSDLKKVRNNLITIEKQIEMLTGQSE